MMPVKPQEDLREALTNYLAGSISIETFNEIERTQNTTNDSPSETIVKTISKKNFLSTFSYSKSWILILFLLTFLMVLLFNYPSLTIAFVAIISLISTRLIKADN